MVEQNRCIILPEHMFPEVHHSTNYNDTRHYKTLLTNFLSTELDENVHGYITDPKNKIYIDPAVKKLVSIDAQLLSTPAQEKTCEFFIRSYTEYNRHKFITVKNLLSSIRVDVPKDTISLLTQGLFFETIEETDYIYLPTQSYRYKLHTPVWYNSDNLKNVIHCMNIFCPVGNKILSYRDVLHYSNNRPLKQEEFTRITQLLKDESSEQVAMNIINTLNPEHSFVELLLLFNYVPQHLRKNKKNFFPFLRELYKFRTDVTHYTLDRIVELHKENFSCDIPLETLEFIADNYYSPDIELSSIFKFKVKVK